MGIGGNGWFVFLLMKYDDEYGINVILTASIMTNTLSFVVGFEGSMPRKERKDFPDCWDIFSRWI